MKRCAACHRFWVIGVCVSSAVHADLVSSSEYQEARKAWQAIERVPTELNEEPRHSHCPVRIGVYFIHSDLASSSAY